MYRQNHCCAVDYFALGVIGYEFMLGRVSKKSYFTLQRPYNGKSRKEIRDAIFAKQVQIKKHEIPDGWTIEAADFINKVKEVLTLKVSPAEACEQTWPKRTQRGKAARVAEGLQLAGIAGKETGCPVPSRAERRQLRCQAGQWS